MKKLLVFFVLACALMVLFSCSNNGGGGGPEFVGTWSQTGGTTETLVFTATTLSITDTGSTVGTMTLAFTSVDESAKHILTSVTSATGFYASLVGHVYYLTYSISGNSLFFYVSQATYPASALWGPYIRQ